MRDVALFATRLATLETSAPAHANGATYQGTGIVSAKSALKNSDTEADLNPEADSDKEASQQTGKGQRKVTALTQMPNREERKVKIAEQLRLKSYLTLVQAMNQKLKKIKMIKIRKGNQIKTSE